MRTSHWKIFTDATSEQKAWKVYQRFLQQLDSETGPHELESYHKGGFVITFGVDLPDESWNAAVVKVLALAQRVGLQWVITGDITHELDGWSNDPKVRGVTNIQVVLEA